MALEPRLAVVFSPVELLSKGEELDILSEQDAANSAQEIASLLARRGFETRCIPVGDRVSDWISELLGFDAHAVFNLAETVSGESSLENFVPGLLDFLDIPYTGSGPRTIDACLDKARTKQILSAAGVPTPAYRVAQDVMFAPQDVALPAIVKPLREDGSLGIHPGSVVRDRLSLRKQIGFVLNRYRQPALIEQYIEGREFNVSVLGNGQLQVLPVCEIDYSRMPPDLPHIVSFNAKWVLESLEYKGSMPICPAPIVGELLGKVQETALAAYKACDLRDYGRIDMRCGPDGIPMVIDVNPNPAITPDAGFILSCQKAGLEYPEVLECIARFALLRK